jgi:hypothetical protein
MWMGSNGCWTEPKENQEMGLDTTHDAWRGAYSAFSRWRNELAEVAGYAFHPYGEPFKLGGTGTEVIAVGRFMVSLDWGNIEATIGPDLFGKWPRVPVRPDGTPDALIVLLAHSDCEGEIQVDMLEPLADRLEELLPLLDKEEPTGHIRSYRAVTERFIRGLRAAAAAGEPLGFH